MLRLIEVIYRNNSDNLAERVDFATDEKLSTQNAGMGDYRVVISLKQIRYILYKIIVIRVTR